MSMRCIVRDLRIEVSVFLFNCSPLLVCRDKLFQGSDIFVSTENFTRFSTETFGLLATAQPKNPDFAWFSVRSLLHTLIIPRAFS